MKPTRQPVGSELGSTEGSDPATVVIDTLTTADLAALLIGAHSRAVSAALAAGPQIAVAIELVAAALDAGGRVLLFGAGTSGRLAVLDASELPPTFGVDPALVVARIAGGDVALRQAVEGAEDDEQAGTAAAHDAGPKDVVIGLSASGGAPFVRAALATARRHGARTIGIANVPGSPLLGEAEIGVVLATGPEPITGSTRLVAGTAQKIALNTISTGAMVRLGKTYGNLMIDVVPSNTKLRERAQRLIRELTGVDDPAELLADGGGRVKTAVVMARLMCDRDTAQTALRAAGGRLWAVIGPRRDAS